MAYRGFYINPLFQHGQKSWRLILQDSDNILPDLWVEKSFTENVTATDLSLFANQEIARQLDVQEKPRQGDIVPTTDTPSNKPIAGTTPRREGDIRQRS